jgi:uncharacterized damage-inducible protein DinB
MAIKESLLAEFDHEAATTRRLLERLPDNKLTWKPHEKSMTMGGLATHLANLPNWGSFILDQPFFDLEASPPNREALSSRSLILEEFDSTIAKARTAMNRSDAEYTALWTLKRGTQEIFTLPRLAALRSFVLSHIIHHRGQLSVYLRLNDVPVPPIYGPSADEG